jgi:cytochrome c peroxidase
MAAAAHPIGVEVHIPVPLGLPPVPIPTDNPPTVDTIALGRRLFFDTKLSSDNTVSCATCHNPATGFAGRTRFSFGVGGQTGKRNAPTVLNSAYYVRQFWDGRAGSLEEQAIGPISDAHEMNRPNGLCAAALQADPTYESEFQKAFGKGPITMDKVQKAVASFERTMLSGDSPFDRYAYGGDPKAISPAAIRGLEVFKNPQKGNCAACHTLDNKYALFTDGKFHNIGVGVGPDGELIDLGRYDVTKSEADKGAFKTPSLRNIAKTGPYMHDGSEKTLKEVVDFYIGGGNSNPHLDDKIKALTLTAQERADLIAFLESLNGNTPADTGHPATQ